MTDDRRLTTDDSLARSVEIARAVRESGGRALIVGGWVRDRLMNVPVKAEPNIDLEVFRIDADRLRALLERFGRVEAVGQSFQVYKLGAIDISLPRRDSKAGRGHRGFVVVGDPDMSIEEAARRRDFTVNAISWDPLSDEYFDPFDGRGDIERRRLRMVDAQTFPDDSLRVLRAIQFVARLGFALDEATRDVCRGIALDDLPAERVWGEFEKLLFADAPSLFFMLTQPVSTPNRSISKLWKRSWQFQAWPWNCSQLPGVERLRLRRKRLKKRLQLLRNRSLHTNLRVNTAKLRLRLQNPNRRSRVLKLSRAINQNQSACLLSRPRLSNRFQLTSRPVFLKTLRRLRNNLSRWVKSRPHGHRLLQRPRQRRDVALVRMWNCLWKSTVTKSGVYTMTRGGLRGC